MAFISKLLLFNLNYFKLNNKAGVFASYVTQKLLPIAANHRKGGILQKNNKSNISKRFFSSEFTAGQRPPKKSAPGGKLVKLNLPLVLGNINEFPRGFLVTVFHKLCVIYQSNKSDYGFQRELKFFLESQTFTNLCETLEKDLHKLAPNELPVLINLVNFKVSPKSVLMQKLFALILDNLHCFSVCDMLEIYSELKQKVFEDVEECKLILKGFEEYFEKYFEDELSHCSYLNDLIFFVSDNSIPLTVRKLICEKLLDLLDSQSYSLSLYPRFFSCALKEPLLSLYKPRLLEKLKMILTDHESLKVHKAFSAVYQKCVQLSSNCYDESLCEHFAANLLKSQCLDSAFIMTLGNLTLMGYYNENVLEKLSDLCLWSELSELPLKTFLSMSSVFLRTSFHENHKTKWDKIKNVFESYNILANFTSLNELSQWAMNLTHMQCNTENLLKEIFTMINEKKMNSFLETTLDFRSVLLLHHLSRKYYPNSNIGLIKKLLNMCLQNGAFRKNFFNVTCVKEFIGGEKYVLYNCITPEFHLLRNCLTV